MAVPQLTQASRRTGATAATLLFERLPDRLFAPLSSVNRHRYWALLCRLHEKRFGPDAPLPPSQGFSAREIVQDIEDELLTQDIWETEDGCRSIARQASVGRRASSELPAKRPDAAEFSRHAGRSEPRGQPPAPRGIPQHTPPSAAGHPLGWTSLSRQCLRKPTRKPTPRGL